MRINIEQYCIFASPIGPILLAGAKETLYLLGLPEGKMQQTPASHWQYDAKPFAACIQQLTEYFAGTRKEFSFKYQLFASEFQHKVLTTVSKIPYGATAAYATIAHKIQQPKAIRAVGGANARNPLPIISPCHRVIAKNGALTGFGGGLHTKRFLLELEGAVDYN
jgi:methylated-DNA-[protein]-cysteine S-methyltransferase